MRFSYDMYLVLFLLLHEIFFHSRAIGAPLTRDGHRIQQKPIFRGSSKFEHQQACVITRFFKTKTGCF